MTVPGITDADNTGGVFGPVVRDGHRAAEYRGGWNPDTEFFVQRLHYESALDDSRMWRIVVQSRHPDGESSEFDFVQGELFWQLADINEHWQTGVRFDVLMRDGDRPGLVSANWTNQLRLGERLTARFLTMVQHDVGQNSRDGIVLQARGRFRYALNDASGGGIELYSVSGPIPELSGFDAQSHQIGPYYDLAFADGWKLFGSVLFGASDAAPDVNLRLWLSYAF